MIKHTAYSTVLWIHNTKQIAVWSLEYFIFLTLILVIGRIKLRFRSEPFVGDFRWGFKEEIEILIVDIGESIVLRFNA